MLLRARVAAVGELTNRPRAVRHPNLSSDLNIASRFCRRSHHLSLHLTFIFRFCPTTRMQAPTPARVCCYPRSTACPYVPIGPRAFTPRVC